MSACSTRHRRARNSRCSSRSASGFSTATSGVNWPLPRPVPTVLATGAAVDVTAPLELDQVAAVPENDAGLEQPGDAGGPAGRGGRWLLRRGDAHEIQGSGLDPACQAARRRPVRLHWRPAAARRSAEARRFHQLEAGGHVMRRSTDRILTTHVGALPAPHDVWAQPDVARRTPRARRWPRCATRRRSAGVDFINEGELTKGGHWTSTSPSRLGGYEPAGHRGGARRAADVEHRLGRVPRLLPRGAAERHAVRAVGSGPARAGGRRGRQRQSVEDWVCTPSRSTSAARLLLEREIDVMKAALGDTPGVRCVPDDDGAAQRRARPRQGHLRDRRGAHLRHRRGDAGRVRGDRRRRVPGAGRRRVARRAVGPHRHPDGPRRLPQVLPDALRSAEPRAAQHPRGADPVPPVLGQLARAALGRPAAARRRRHHAVGQGADLLDRGRQRPPRARGGALGGRPSCPTARSSPPVS